MTDLMASFDWYDLHAMSLAIIIIQFPQLKGVRSTYMLNLFESVSHIESGRVALPGIDYFKRTYNRELERVKQYYMDGIRAVPNDHLLCRLLITGTIPSKYDLDRYVELSIIRAPELIRYFKLTSEVSYGLVRPSEFYGEGMDEIIIAYDDYFDIESNYRDWKNINAVRVLEHPISDLNMHLPNGEQQTQESGLIVLGINIPLLQLQYRAFKEEQYKNFIQYEIEPLNVANFVYMYVLPNMLSDQLDGAILNRMIKLHYGDPMGVSLRRHPFNVTDYSANLDRSIVKFLGSIGEKRKLYEWYLKNLPALIVKDQELAQQVPDLTPTRQVWWAIIISRLKVINFLIDLGGEEGLKSNGTYIGQLKIDFRRLVRDSPLKRRLGDELEYEVFSVINKVLDL